MGFGASRRGLALGARGLTLLLSAIALFSPPAAATDDHLLLCEVSVLSDPGEFIEIANFTGATVQLADYYLSDDWTYAYLAGAQPGLDTGGPAPSIGRYDFLVGFPDTASIDDGEVLVVAVRGSDFLDSFDYELVDTDNDPTNDMRTDPTHGLEVGDEDDVGLTDNGENVVLFYWDEASQADLVRDVDIYRWAAPTPANDLKDKSTIDPVDGPDIGTSATAYAPDALTMGKPPKPGTGTSMKRAEFEGSEEVDVGGNGVYDDDETSENALATWDSAYSYVPENPGRCPLTVAAYYEEVDASDQASLRATLGEAVEDHFRFSYDGAWEILEAADADPDDDLNRILDIYRNASYPKDRHHYQREHSWPSSYGYPKDGQDASNDTDKHNYPFSDCHALFLADAQYNGSRGNTLYRDCDPACEEKLTLFNDGQGGGSGPYPGNSNWREGVHATGSWETWRHRRGDVARAAFYLDVRYEGETHAHTGSVEPDLVLSDSQTDIAQTKADAMPSDDEATWQNLGTAYMGMRADLLQWHQEDPVDWREMVRNELVYRFQRNRNPFIDHPEWVACLFSGTCAGASTCELSITNDDGQDEAVPGQPLTYTVEVSNAGPDDGSGVQVAYTFDPERIDLASVSWTCTPGPGVGTACPASGSAAELAGGVSVSMAGGDSVTFEVTATPLPAFGDLVSTASVVPSAAARDPTPWANRATDTDTLLGPCGAEVDLELSQLSVTASRLFAACRSIAVGPDFEVAETGDVTLRSGFDVAFANNFSVLSGGNLAVELDPALFGPPVAHFEYSGGVTSHTVEFSELCAGAAPLSYDWDFGDGTPHGTAANPTHVYGGNGTYFVTLTVTNSFGSDSFSSPVSAFEP